MEEEYNEVVILSSSVVNIIVELSMARKSEEEKASALPLGPGGLVGLGAP